jgi:hypothetical protein
MKKMQHYTMVFITINALHVSGGSSAHHQELKTLYTASGICRAFSASYRFREFELTHDSSKKRKKLDKYLMLRIQFSAPGDGQRNRLKHVEHL